MKIKRFILGAILAAVSILAIACGDSGYVSKEELPNILEEFYASKQPNEEKKLEEFTQFYKLIAESRSEEFKKWLNENSPSKEEKLAEFNEFYAGVTSISTEQRTEIVKLFNQLLLNGEHEIPSLVLHLSKVDPEDEVLGRARQISGELIFAAPLEEAVAIYKQAAEERAATLGKSAEGTDEQPQEEEKPEDVLPSNAIISPDGIVRILIYTPPESVGYLGQDHIITNGQAYSIICMANSLQKPEFVKNLNITFRAISNAAEAAWKEEIIFSGKAVSMCSEGEDAPTYYPDINFTVFKRPQIKLFTVPSDEPIKVAKVTELKQMGRLLFPTSTDEGLIMLEGRVLRIREGGAFGHSFIEFLGVPAIAPSSWDVGAPVYYIARDTENPIRLVGFIVEAGGVPAIAFPADYILEKIEEFSHELIN